MTDNPSVLIRIYDVTGQTELKNIRFSKTDPLFPVIDMIYECLSFVEEPDND